MTTPLRFIPDEAKMWKDAQGERIAVAEVTIRCIMGTYLLVPKQKHVSILRGVIGRAQDQIGFELYGYGYLSNHGSLLLGVRSAEQLSRVMEFVHGNIARELGRKEYSNWQGRFWERRGRAILVLSDEDLEDRMRYLLSNSTKENLVKHPSRWPGAHCARALCDGTTDTGLWIDRTGLFFANRKRGAKVVKSDYETHYDLTLSKLPCWKDLSDDEHRQKIKAMCAEIAEEAEAAREESGEEVLGEKAVQRVDPHYRPEELDRSPAPPVHCNDKEARNLFLEAYHKFRDTYRTATAALRDGLEKFQFPAEGIPHGCHFCPDTG